MLSPIVNFFRYFSFCSSVPNLSSPQHTNELFTDIHTETEASILEISSMANTYEIESMPPPLYFGSVIIPIKPNSPIFFICSAGNRCSLSRSITPGKSSVIAKSLAACWTESCSSVSSKFIWIADYKIYNKQKA